MQRCCSIKEEELLLIKFFILILQVYIWQLKNTDLVGIAFIDTQIYIHQLLCIKSLILAADICKSIFLLRFQEENRTLSLVSRVITFSELIEMFVYM